MNFSELILSALLPRNKFEKSSIEEAFKELAKSRITPEYFTGNYKLLFNLATNQFPKEAILDQDILEAQISSLSLDDEKKTELRILFTTCREQTIPLDKLQEILPAFIEQVNTMKFREALLTTGKILTEGQQNGKIKLQGLSDAKKYLIGNISGLKSNDSTPEGAVQDSIERFWENYNLFENNPLAGVKTGFGKIDALTNGVRKGELITLAGFSGHGKSQILRNWFYNAAVFQNKNVVYITLEMPKDQIVNQLMSLHSTHPKFQFREGIRAKDIDDAVLKPDQKEQLEIVAEDWKQVEGRAYIKQLPHGATVATIREFLTYINTLFKVDCIYLDYAGLLRPEYNRQTTMADIASVYNDLKLLCLDFNGEGIPCFSGWQVSRNGLEQAEKSKDKRYTINCLADSSAVERASDMVISCLFPEEFQLNHEVKMQVLKNRRGPKIPDWWMMEQFHYSKLEDMVMSMTHSEVDSALGDINLI